MLVPTNARPLVDLRLFGNPHQLSNVIHIPYCQEKNLMVIGEFLIITASLPTFFFFDSSETTSDFDLRLPRFWKRAESTMPATQMKTSSGLKKVPGSPTPATRDGHRSNMAC